MRGSAWGLSTPTAESSVWDRARCASHEVNKRCRYDDNKARGCYAQPTSHTGRYHIAAELGLVPPLGVRHG